ncbi:MAG: heat shock protein transcriptional repressor HspR [Solirubrobacterales bacterium]
MAQRRKSRRSDKTRVVPGRGRLDETRGVFMISVAAELADMHPQTLRMYEARGLISPQRSAKNTRLYSQRDVEQLRRIQQMTTEEGLNLAGVETVLELERTVTRMRTELARMRERAAEMERRIDREVEQARRALRAEIVPYGAYDVIGADDAPTVKIQVERPDRPAPRGDGA